MKGRIFIVTLVAASLMSFGAFAGGTRVSVGLNHFSAAIGVYTGPTFEAAKVTQVITKTSISKGSVVTQAAAIVQNSPISVNVGF
jgi:hypothetical protein